MTFQSWLRILTCQRRGHVRLSCGWICIGLRGAWAHQRCQLSPESLRSLAGVWGVLGAFPTVPGISWITFLVFAHLKTASFHSIDYYIFSNSWLDLLLNFSWSPQRVHTWSLGPVQGCRWMSTQLCKWSHRFSPLNSSYYNYGCGHLFTRDTGTCVGCLTHSQPSRNLVTKSWATPTFNCWDHTNHIINWHCSSVHLEISGTTQSMLSWHRYIVSASTSPNQTLGEHKLDQC